MAFDWNNLQTASGPADFGSSFGTEGPGDVLITPQDFRLNYVNLIAGDGSVLNIKNLIIEFNLYEDIFSIGTTGDVVVNDSNDLLSFLSLTGNEYISFLLEKPALETSIEKTYKLISVSNRRMTNDTNETYLLHFCAEEIPLSEQYRVSKSYKNKKVSEIVRDICENYLNINTNKQISYNPLRIEETKNTLDLIVPNLKPFDAINWLSNYAQSSNIASPSTYLFFQNYFGFNFQSLQSLYEFPAFKTYNYEPKNLASESDNRVKDLAKDLQNVISYEVIDQFNSLNSITTGSFANKLISVDLINQSYDETEFDYQKYFPFSKHLNGYSLLPNAKNSQGDTVNKTPDGYLKLVTGIQKQSRNPYVLSKAVSIKNTEIEKYIPHRTSEMSLLTSNRIRLIVPGDPLISVGRNIIFNMPSIGLRDNGGKNNDTYLSGKYLITSVRHKADQSGVFLSIIEICKESVPTPLRNYSDNRLSLSSIGI
jgi:hypothetical protein